MQKEYRFPHLLPGEGCEPGRPIDKVGTVSKLKVPEALTRVKYVTTHSGKVFVAEYICNPSSGDHILVPGWVVTEPYQLNNGQLRITVQPLTKEEQQDNQRFILPMFLKSKIDLRFFGIEVELRTPIVFWNPED